MNGKQGLSLALCPPIPQQTISQCETRFINVGFQQCGHDQFKQHQCPPPFLSPCSFICAEPVHTVFLLSLSTSPWRRKKRDRNGKNIIHQLTPSAGSVTVQSDQIKDTCQYVKYFATVQEHSPWGVSMFWPAEHCHHTPDRPSRNSVWSSPGINTLCQAKQTWILCNYYPVLQPSPGNKSTKIYT